jgi:hypothetical protein
MYPENPIPSLGSSSQLYIPLIKSESDGNYPKVRRKTTKARKKFELDYKNILHSEFQVLEDFFVANQGLSFDFTEPLSGTIYTCVFMQDELDKSYDTVNTVSTTIKLEEV